MKYFDHVSQGAGQVRPCSFMREHLAPRLARGGVLALNISRQNPPGLARDVAAPQRQSDSSGGTAEGRSGAGAAGGSVVYDGPTSLDGPDSLDGPTLLDGLHSLDGPDALDGPTLLDAPILLLDGPDARDAPHTLDAPTVLDAPPWLLGRDAGDGLAASDGPETQEGGARECLRPFLEAMSAAGLCDGPGAFDGPDAQKVMCAEGVCGWVRGGDAFAGQVCVCVCVCVCAWACVRVCV